MRSVDPQLPRRRRWALLGAGLLLLMTLLPATARSVAAADLLPTVWYFAEGFTGTGFDEYLTIQNPNPTTANIRVTYYKTDGTTKIYERTVGGQTRATVIVHDPVEGIGRVTNAAGVSAKVESLNGVGIVVERPMYFTYFGSFGQATDGHNVLGANAPQPVWYFAEGYTGTGFEEYLTIMNPNDVDATVTLTYYLSAPSGSPPPAPITKQITVLKTSRYTVEVHKTTDGVGLNKEVSAKVETDPATPIVVERPMYFNYSNGSTLTNITGGHNVIGANSPQPAWYFPFAATGSRFDTYATIMNVFPTAAQVRLTFYPRSGAPTSHTFQVAGNSRYSLNLRDSPAVGNNRIGGFKLETLNGVNLVAERPMYFNYRFVLSANGGINGLGATSAGPVWLFAEGFTSSSFDVYLEILNPSGTAANVQITYYLTSGAPKTTTLSVAANSQRFVWANDNAEVGQNKTFSVRVEALGGGQIVVERIVFFRYAGQTDGGHGIIGFQPLASP